jgi:hypothetical protein
MFQKRNIQNFNHWMHQRTLGVKFIEGMQKKYIIGLEWDLNLITSGFFILFMKLADSHMSFTASKNMYYYRKPKHESGFSEEEKTKIRMRRLGEGEEQGEVI